MNLRLPTRLFENFDPDWKSLTVRIVTFPAPPTIKALGVVYPEDCWRSDVLERGEEIFNKHSTCLASRMTDRGPAFLLEHTLGSLFESGSSRTTAPKSIYCASISFATILETPSLIYPTDAVIENVRSIERSCHPGSHTVAPGMPWFTTLLSLDRASSISIDDNPTFKFADDEDAEKYFPGFDLSMNQSVDRLFSRAPISPLGNDIRVPDVFSLRVFQRILELSWNEDLWVKSDGEVDKYLISIDNRERRKSNEHRPI